VRAVIDTNVWISAALTPHSVTGQVIEHFNRDAFQPVFCPSTVAELRAAFSKPRIARRIGLRFTVLDTLVSTLVTTDEEREDPVVTPLTRDPADDVFVALALAARADFLVSGDRDLLDDPAVPPAPRRW
jgi:putative PIN family toxin of toxin-antitoxin system